MLTSEENRGGLYKKCLKGNGLTLETMGGLGLVSLLEKGKGGRGWGGVGGQVEGTDEVALVCAGTSVWIDPDRNIFVVLLSNAVHPTAVSLRSPMP